MKRGKSKLLSGLLSMSMAFSVISAPIEAFAATDTSGHWAEASINNWINSGFISGYPDGTFRPNNAISRAEFVTLANRAFGFTRSQGISFDDVKLGYWAYGEIQKGVAAGYIQGDSNGKFRPGSAVTRQEAAVMLSKLKGYDSDEAGAYNYTDRGDMANWAVGAIGAVSRNGIMSGYPNGTFRPQQSLTRAEAVASLQKVAGSSNSFTSVNTTNYTSPNYVTTNTNSGLSSDSSTRKTSSDNDYGFSGIVLEDTKMENRNLTRDLLIPRSLGSKNITLKNVRLKGTLYVEGGGNITLENCNITNVVMDRANAVLKNNGSSDIEEVRFEEKGRLDGKGYGTVLIDDNSISEVILDADIDTLILDAEVDVKLYANSNIDTFEVTKNADNARIRIGEDAQVSDMQIYDKVRISGKGKIDVMTVYVSNVRSEIEPKRLIQQDNARKPNFSYKDDDDDDDYDNLTLDSDDENFDGEDDDFDRVRISAEDVTAKDFTVHDDLIITSSAGDSTIELEDVTVRGDVYVEGGGDSSVIFDDCNINGSIYSRKSTGGRYDEAVAIKLRNTPVRGNVYVTGDTILESDEKLKKVVLNRELSKTFRMNANAENLTINYNNTVQIRGNHTIDTAEVAAGLNNVSITMDGGKIGTFTVRSPIRMDGTGTIDKLVTGEANDISSNITIGTTEKIDGSGTTPSGSYTITASVQGGNGSISPNGQQSVTKGANKEFVITANAGYHVAAIIVDDNEVNLNNNSYQGYIYTFNNVTANHNIIVSFTEGAGNGTGSGSNGTTGDDDNKPSEGDYTITAEVNNTSLGTHNLDNQGIVAVKDGEDLSVTFTAENGNHIAKLFVDDVELQKVSGSNITYKQITYVFHTVTANHTIKAEFAPPEATGEDLTIHSTDDDIPSNVVSGYQFNAKTNITYVDNTALMKNEETGTYYCHAGETLKLSVEELEVINYPEEEGLKTRWTIRSSTPGMIVDLKNGEDGEAILETTQLSGYTANVGLQIYDTARDNKVVSEREQLFKVLVDVPIQRFRLGNSDNDNNISFRGKELVLTSQEYIYEPKEASSYYEQQEIEWVIDEDKPYEIDKVSGIPDEKQWVHVDIVKKEKNNKINYSLIVNQTYINERNMSATVDRPKGTVYIKAILPNGKGKMQDYVQHFKVNFIGNKVIAVTEIDVTGEKTLTIEGKQTINLNSAISTAVYPLNADYKTVQWEIVDDDIDDGHITKGKEIATIQKDSQGYNTILSTNGKIGKIRLRAYIANGESEGKDFINPAGSDVIVVVNTVPPELNVTARVAEGSNTNEGGKINLTAEVINANNTGYTTIKGWEKSYDNITWTPLNFVDANPLNEVVYTVTTDDLNENRYQSKTMYFRAYIEYEDENLTPTTTTKYSESVSIDCQAQQVTFPNRTDSGASIITLQDGVRSIAGYDTVTLPETVDGRKITWSIVDAAEKIEIAELISSNKLQVQVKGKPEETFTLNAQVENMGNSEFNVNIKTVFKPIEAKESTIFVSNELDSEIKMAAPAQTIHLKSITVGPATASYHGYSGPSDKDVNWQVEIKEDKNKYKPIPNAVFTTVPGKDYVEYTIPKEYAGKTLCFSAVWKNGALIKNSTKVTNATSDRTEIEILNDIIAVEGIDFSSTWMGKLDPFEGNIYKCVIPAVTENISINLSKAVVVPSTATNRQINWSIKGDTGIDPDVASFKDSVLTIPGYAEKGTVTLEARVANGLAENQDYVATLILEIPKGTAPKPESSQPGTGTEDKTDGKSSASEEANTFNLPQPSEDNADTSNPINDVVSNENNTENPGTENNKDTAENESNKNDVPEEDNKVQDNTNEIVIPFTAVSDINFDDINDLQKLPSQEYTITSDRTKQITLRLADSTSTVNGITKHTGIKVLPTNATNKTVTWSAKNTTLTAIPNIVQVNGIGTLNQNSNIFIIDANASGKVTLIATVKNGKTEKDNFVKELVIHVNKPASDTSNEIKEQKQSNESNKTTNNTSSNTTNNTSSNTTTTSNMPSNTTQAVKKQVISVGDTSVGTSSVTSASASNTRNNTNVTSAARSTSSSDVRIETGGQCKKGISVPLKAISKSSQREYTDVDWEITDDGGTNARITSGNRLRATSTGTVTVTATIYTSSGTMVCSTDISVSD